MKLKRTPTELAQLESRIDVYRHRLTVPMGAAEWLTLRICLGGMLERRDVLLWDAEVTR